MVVFKDLKNPKFHYSTIPLFHKKNVASAFTADVKEEIDESGEKE
jgi:hypothetical protein